MPINWFRAELGLTVFNVWEENGERVGFTTIFFFFFLVELLIVLENQHLKNQEPDFHVQFILG